MGGHFHGLMGVLGWSEPPSRSYIHDVRLSRTPAICDDCSWVNNLLNRPGGPVR